MIYSKVENPKCYFCVYQTPIENSVAVNCSKKGVVSEDFLCKKFKYDILKREVKRLPKLNTSRFSKDDFEI